MAANDPIADIRSIGPTPKMSRNAPLEQQITANLETVEVDSHFDTRVLWLTFYLTGEPSRLWEVADELSTRGWRNTDGWEGAFLYPKIEVERSIAAIVEVAESVLAMCTPRGVEIINIDADTSPDVGQSKFVTLYRA